MKAINFSVFLVAFLLLGCQSKINKQLEDNEAEISRDSLELTNVPSEVFSDEDMYIEEANHIEYDPAQTLYFDHAFVYKHTTKEGKLEEFWILHNPETGLMLYDPDDQMVDFVVSDTLGNYYFFGSDGHGNKTVDSQFVEWVANPDLYDENETYPYSDRYVILTPTGNKKSMDRYSTIDGKPIVSEEYSWEFKQLGGDQTAYITEMIPVNFYQVYGFNKLEGDIRLPDRHLDFVGTFGKNQTVTQFKSGDYKTELDAYTYTTYFAEAGDYQYSVRQADGSWKKEVLPLLSSK